MYKESNYSNRIDSILPMKGKASFSDGLSGVFHGTNFVPPPAGMGSSWYILNLLLSDKEKPLDLLSFFLPTEKEIYQLLGNIPLMRESNLIHPGHPGPVFIVAHLLRLVWAVCIRG